MNRYGTLVVLLAVAVNSQRIVADSEYSKWTWFAGLLAGVAWCIFCTYWTAREESQAEEETAHDEYEA